MQDPDFHLLHKLDFYRESGHQRHLRDIAGMIEQQELDLARAEAASLSASLGVVGSRAAGAGGYVVTAPIAGWIVEVYISVVARAT